jgi:2,3-bisphosphoglycerate-independent phosphoglycerate mutase
MGPKFLFLFLDGVGVGIEGGCQNPFSLTETPHLVDLLGGRLTETLAPRVAPGIIFSTLDATQGFDGLPQSATGQAALVTGINAAGVMGGHYGPWPGPTLKAILDKGTIFSEAQSLKGGAVLANAYPPGFFEALEAGRLKVNVPVYSILASGASLPTMEALEGRTAVSSDLTREELIRKLPLLVTITPQEAGSDLASIARSHNLTFFDFWIPDRVGHRGSLGEAVAIVEKFDGFLGGVLNALDPDITLIITSDHGNIENMGSRSHTRSPVPLIVVGPKADRFIGLQGLTDVPRAMLDVWREV